MAAAYLEPREISQGNTYEDTIKVSTSAGVPVNFSSGYTGQFQVRAGTVDGGSPALVTLTGTGITFANGFVKVTLTPAQTTSLISATAAPKLYAELDLTETATEDVTSFRWELTILREYARSS